jgi:hypothetical protein
MLTSVIVLVLVGYLAAILIAWVWVNMAFALPSWSATIFSPFAWMTEDSNRRSTRQRLERELASRVQRGTRADEQLVEAAHATLQIQVAHLWLKESTTLCLETHWALARGLAVEHMSEAASHPRAVVLRQHNLELAEFLGDIIKDYPYPTAELIHLEVAVPRLAATCAACPYWFVSRRDAPAVCPSARALGYRSGASTSSQSGIVVDAEPVFRED